MRPFQYIFIAVIALVMGFIGASFVSNKGGAVAVAKKETAHERVLRTGHLRCGYASWEPMLIIDPNTKQLSGVAYDVINRVGEEIGVKVDWAEEIGWADFPTALANGRIDAFCSGSFINSQRGRVIDFTNPFAYSPLYAYVRADDTRFDQDISLLDKPENKVVHSVGGTEGITARQKFGHATIYTISQTAPSATVFLEVAANKADATVIDASTGDLFIKANPGKVKRAGPALHAFPHVISIKKGEYELQQVINNALQDLSNSGEIDAILKKYEPAPYSYYRVAKPYDDGTVK